VHSKALSSSAATVALSATALAHDNNVDDLVDKQEAEEDYSFDPYDYVRFIIDRCRLALLHCVEHTDGIRDRFAASCAIEDRRPAHVRIFEDRFLRLSLWLVNREVRHAYQSFVHA